MSYRAEVKKNSEVSYACSNMSWHFMLSEIEGAVEEKHKPSIQKLQEASHDGKSIRWYECRAVAAALETVKNGVDIFSGAQDVQALLNVFRTAAEMKSSVYIG